MSIYALSDPHLSFSVPNKKMDHFGDNWINHPQKIQTNWLDTVTPKDIVLIPGDISWATKLNDALTDLAWIDNLPGKKILLRGNHDLWWPSLTKLQNLPFPSLFFVHHQAIQVDDFCFFGSRLWDTNEYTTSNIKWRTKPPAPLSTEKLAQQEKIYTNELLRLNLSIDALQKFKHLQSVGICHYPPLGSSMNPSRASNLFESTNTEHVIFGHLHSLIDGKHYGKLNNIEYHLTACDYLHFKPTKIYDF